MDVYFVLCGLIFVVSSVAQLYIVLYRFRCLYDRLNSLEHRLEVVDSCLSKLFGVLLESCVVDIHDFDDLVLDDDDSELFKSF